MLTPIIVAYAHQGTIRTEEIVSHVIHYAHHARSIVLIVKHSDII